MNIPKRLRVRVVLYWAAFVAVGLLVSTRPPLIRFLDFWETLPYLLFLFLLAARPVLRTLLGELDTGRRVLALGFFALLFAGQIASDSKRTYPFVQWKMYTSIRPGTTWLEYEAGFASGDRRHYPFEEVGPRSSPRAFMGRFQRTVERVEKNPSALHGKDAAGLLADMRHLARLYNRRNQDDSITNITVYRRTVPVRAYTGPESVERRRLAVPER